MLLLVNSAGLHGVGLNFLPMHPDDLLKNHLLQCKLWVLLCWCYTK